MKITGIDSSKTDLENGVIALKTIPPLTQEVFDFAVKHFWSTSSSDQFDFANDGLLRVMRSTLPRIRIEEYESALTSSETAVSNKKAAAQDDRKDFLESLSDESGLPVE